MKRFLFVVVWGLALVMPMVGCSDGDDAVLYRPVQAEELEAGSGVYYHSEYEDLYIVFKTVYGAKRIIICNPPRTYALAPRYNIVNDSLITEYEEWTGDIVVLYHILEYDVNRGWSYTWDNHDLDGKTPKTIKESMYIQSIPGNGKNRHIQIRGDRLPFGIKAGIYYKSLWPISLDEILTGRVPDGTTDSHNLYDFYGYE